MWSCEVTVLDARFGTLEELRSPESCEPRGMPVSGVLEWWILLAVSAAVGVAAYALAARSMRRGAVLAGAASPAGKPIHAGETRL